MAARSLEEEGSASQSGKERKQVVGVVQQAMGVVQHRGFFEPCDAQNWPAGKVAKIGVELLEERPQAVFEEGRLSAV